jgi:hypothetical protein
MKKLLLCILFSSATGLFSQNIKCVHKKSAVIKNEHKDAKFLRITEDADGGFVTLSQKLAFRSSKSDYYLEHYSSDMKHLKSAEYEALKSDNLGSFTVGDNFVMIDIAYDKKRKAYVCFAHSASLNDFNFTKTELFVLERKEVQTSSAWGYGLSGSADYDTGAKMNINSSKNAFVISIDIDDKENKEARRLYVFDFKLNKKFDALIKSESKDRDFEVENIELSNGGDMAYVLGKVRTKEASRKKDGGKYEYAVYGVNSTEIKSRTFHTGEHYADDLRAVITKNNLVCVGLYSDEKDRLCKGICYFRLDPQTLEIKEEKFNTFGADFYKDKFGNDEKDEKKEVKNYGLKSVHVTENDNILLNAEEWTFTSHTYNTGHGVGVSTVSYYMDILCAKLNSSGDLEWSRNINKFQKTGDYFFEYMSYTPAFYHGKSYFFLNCNGQLPNYGNSLSGLSYGSSQDANVIVIRIDENANFEFQKLISKEGDDLKFWINKSKVGGKNTYLYGMKGNKIQFLRASF